MGWGGRYSLAWRLGSHHLRRTVRRSWRSSSTAWQRRPSHEDSDALETHAEVVFANALKGLIQRQPCEVCTVRLGDDCPGQRGRKRVADVGVFVSRLALAGRYWHHGHLDDHRL